MRVMLLVIKGLKAANMWMAVFKQKVEIPGIIKAPLSLVAARLDRHGPGAVASA